MNNENNKPSSLTEEEHKRFNEVLSKFDNKIIELINFDEIEKNTAIFIKITPNVSYEFLMALPHLLEKYENIIKEKNLSVRQTEELVRKLYKGDTTVKNSIKPTLSPAYKRIEDNLASHFSTRVKLHHSKKGNGSITIEYYSLQELNKILDQMGASN